MIDEQIWASVWMHKCVSGSYKLVLYSFTALPAAGLPVQIACLLRCVYGRDDRDLATVLEPHRTDKHTGSDKLHPDDFQMRCFLLLASCKFWIARFIAGI